MKRAITAARRGSRPTALNSLARVRGDGHGARMYELPLSGAQKSHLRGLGQTLPDHLKVGKAGLTTEFFGELQKFLRTQELVKLRFLGADRDEKAELCARIADEGRCVCVGAVGHTALFYRPNPDPKARVISLP